MRGAPWLVLLLPVLAGAAERPVDYGKSEITFAVKQMGVTVSGRFKRFSAAIDFDPQRPEASSVAVEVDVSSIDTGDDDADATALDKPWLNAAGFPKAGFRSSAIRARKDGFEATGTLTLRGKPRELTIPFSAASRPDGTMTARGEFAIRRTDFGIGGGEWNEEDLVADEVKVRFNITLTGPKEKP